MSEKSDNLKVFISYSRVDTRFANELVDGLKALGGFDVYIDKHAIKEGEEWKPRLAALIEVADTVVFVLSPDSAKSEICQWEVDYAESLNKRLLPVLCRPLGDEKPPKQLAAINYRDFTTDQTLMSGIKSLATALQEDLAWLKESTRLLTLALDWDRAERRANRLLSGQDIVDAKKWIADCPKSAEVTELHRDFVKASEEQEVARLSEERKKADALTKAVGRFKRAVIALGILLVGLGAVGYNLRVQIDKAERAEKEAKVERDRAEKNLDEAQLTQSKFLTDKSNGYIINNQPVIGALLALEGLKHKNSSNQTTQTRLLHYPAHVSLDGAMRNKLEKEMLKGHTSTVRSVIFSPDGKRLASASDDPTMRLWDGVTGKELAVLKGHTDSVTSVVFSPDGKRLASASNDSMVRLWDGVADKALAVLKGHTKSVTSVVFSPDGKRLASTSWDKTVRLWDGVTCKALAVLKGHTSTVNSVIFSPDGKRLASASDDSTVRLWDGVTGKALAVLKGHESTVTSVVFSPEGKRLASASTDKMVRLWDGVTGKALAVLKGHESTVWNVVFSPDGKRLASASDDKTVRLWNGMTGKELAVLKRHESTVNSVIFSPDGKRLASASDDSTVRLWDGVTGKALAVLKGHESTVTSVIFSPDSKRLASASTDKTVRLWDAVEGKGLAALKGHTNFVNSVVFSSDGKRLASADGSIFGKSDNTVRLWDVRHTGQALIDHAKAQLPRCLTQAQRIQYGLSSQPPRWCITGYGPGIKPNDPSSWQPKWPYHTAAWKKWQLARDRGKELPLPE